MVIKMVIGDRIKALRKEAKLTQKQLGELCNINEANIRKYESNRQIPKISTLKRIADALDVSVGYLQGYEPINGKEIYDALENGNYEHLLKLAQNVENRHLLVALSNSEDEEKINLILVQNFLATVANDGITNNEYHLYMSLLFSFSCLNENGKIQATKEMKKLLNTKLYLKNDS